MYQNKSLTSVDDFVKRVPRRKQTLRVTTRFAISVRPMHARLARNAVKRPSAIGVQNLTHLSAAKWITSRVTGDSFEFGCRAPADWIEKLKRVSLCPQAPRAYAPPQVMGRTGAVPIIGRCCEGAEMATKDSLARLHDSESAEERTQKIVETALALAEEGGFEAVRLRDVAAHAGVAMGTLYRRFRSKEDLLVAALEYETRGLARRVEQRPLVGEDPLTRVMGFFKMATRGCLGAPIWPVPWSRQRHPGIAISPNGSRAFTVASSR